MTEMYTCRVKDCVYNYKIEGTSLRTCKLPEVSLNEEGKCTDIAKRPNAKQ